MEIYKLEKELHLQGYKNILGTDEAGRGPMAGPLVAASVILPEDFFLEELNDSKKLSPKKREMLFEVIVTKAVEVQTEIISVDDVDRLNVFGATKKAMLSCINKMKTKVDYVLTDAVKLKLNIPCVDIIKGDAKVAAIAAASIVAKVTRDRLMEEYDLIYPKYGFKKHKGYVTKQHLEMLKKYGPCPLHRESFEPVKKEMYKQIKLSI